MKKFFFTLIVISSTLINFSKAQTILFSEDFNSGSSTQLTMNTTDVGSAGTIGNHMFYINNSYTGATATADVPCLGSTFPVSITSVTTPNQPVGISGFPNSHYMHINAQCANAVAITNTYFIYSSGTCFTAESYFTKMTNDISTIGNSNVELSFWYIMGGFSGVIYGEAYYSTNGGSNWTLIPTATLVNQQTWSQVSFTNPAFDNQATLRFGFRWYCGNTGGTPTDPALGIDDIKVSAPTTVSLTTSDALPDTVCIGNSCLVDYSSTGGTFNAGNIFSIELSDLAGSFALPIVIGTFNSTAASGTINCTVPLATTPGTTYKLRVVSTNPGVTGIQCPGTLKVVPLPVASFTFSSNGLTVTFTNTSSGGTDYAWDFGDGTSSNLQIPLPHTYTTSGSHIICLAVTNLQACSDSSCQTFTFSGINKAIENSTINVYPNPADKMINIELPESVKSIIHIQLVDVSGRIVFDKTVSASFHQELILPQLADGIYWLKLNGEEFQSGKSILIHSSN